MTACKMIIHGGASSDYEGGFHPVATFQNSMQTILEKSYPVLEKFGAKAAILFALKHLEDDPIFNAGTGSRIQADGVIRMSCGICHGNKKKLAGVVNIESIQNPSAVVGHLLEEKHSILAGPQARNYAMVKGFKTYDPTTPHRKMEFDNKIKGKTGTVGVVAIDKNGELYAANSTGGTGCEIPGRMSDCVTVAGTYATNKVGVACTGVGEQIVGNAIATNVVFRVEAGASLEDAARAVIEDASKKDLELGFIALDHLGNIVHHKTTNTHLVYGYHDGENIKVSEDSET